jgi:hypothetical protein
VKRRKKCSRKADECSNHRPPDNFLICINYSLCQSLSGKKLKLVWFHCKLWLQHVFCRWLRKVYLNIAAALNLRETEKIAIDEKIYFSKISFVQPIQPLLIQTSRDDKYWHNFVEFHHLILFSNKFSAIFYISTWKLHNLQIIRWIWNLPNEAL